MVLGRKLQSNLSALYSPPASKPAAQTDALIHPPRLPSPRHCRHSYRRTSSFSHTNSSPNGRSYGIHSKARPHLPSLQPKHRDSMVTRAYSVLAKLPPLPCSPQPNHPNLIHARRSNYGRTRSSAFYTPPRAASSPLHSEIRLPGFASPSSVPPPPLLPFLLLSLQPRIHEVKQEKEKWLESC
jgi:hypothetical protein